MTGNEPKENLLEQQFSRPRAEECGRQVLPRLLVITSTYPRWAGDPEPGFVHELSRRLVSRFEVMVVCPHAARAKRREKLDGLHVHRYAYAPTRLETLVNDGGILANLASTPWKWLLLPGFVLAQWLQVIRLRQSWRPDIVHAHWLLPQGIVAALSGASRVVVTSHGADLFALNGGFFRWLRSLVATRAKAVTVVSDAMRKRLQAECPRANVLTMPMGVDLENRFTPDSASVIRSADTILFVGRLVAKKGLIHLINAMPKVLDRRPAARLEIIGFGPELNRLTERVNELGISHAVHFGGPVPQDQLPRHYQSAAVFVAPFVEAVSGDQEGLGLVVAEAIGCLCPVIVGDVPAVRDFFGENKDNLVPQGDSNAITQAILHVLADPEGARQRAMQLRAAVASRFSWASVADDYAKLFETLLRAGASA